MSNGNIDSKIKLKPKVVYQPQFKENQIVRFKRFVENKYNVELKDYFELQEWSFKNYPEFWDCVWTFFDVLYSTPYTEVFDKKKGFLNGKWFEGVRLNYTANILKYRDSRTAIISVDDEGNTQRVTYEELHNEIKVYIKALKDAGIQKEDVVACYMTNKIEAVFAFLATAAIGAKWSGCQPLFGAKSVLSRYKLINPKILFTSGSYYYDGTEIRMEIKVQEIATGLPSLEKVVFVPSKLKGKAENISIIPKCVILSDFLKESRKALESDLNEIEFEQFPFDHPICISYTSGTTGTPKCLVHSAGMFLVSLKDFGIMHDCTRDDNLLHTSTVGWISWHMHVNCLHLGLTITLYEGDPFMTSPTRLWDVLDEFGITSACAFSCVWENMERKGYIPTENHSLKTLKQIYAMASLTKPQTINFLAEKIKENVFCFSSYGSTECCGLISAFDSNQPVYEGEMQGLSLGMDLRILDDNDQPVIGKRGEVVLANPYPGLPVSILKDEHQEIITSIYLTQHPGYWNIGDDACINPATKGLIVYGRSDDTMNPKGKRFNCLEIYSALEGFPGIVDSVCVSQFNSSLDERAVLFVKMDSGVAFGDDVQEEIKKTITQNQCMEHVPDVVIQAPDIPYNLNGKKLTGLVKKLINKRPITNADIVVNPASLEFYKTVVLEDF